MAFCGSREFSHNHAGPSQARKACKANIKKIANSPSENNHSD